MVKSDNAKGEINMVSREREIALLFADQTLDHGFALDQYGSR